MLNTKRDRLDILVEVLAACKEPQTQNEIKLKAKLPQDLMQNYIIQLLLNHWIEQSEIEGNIYYLTTKRGLDFLEKWIKIPCLQADFENPRVMAVPVDNS